MDETFEGRFAQAQLLWGNISARPLRAFLSILAITIQVFLVLMIGDRRYKKALALETSKTAEIAQQAAN